MVYNFWCDTVQSTSTLMVFDLANYIFVDSIKVESTLLRQMRFCNSCSRHCCCWTIDVTFVISTSFVVIIVVSVIVIQNDVIMHIIKRRCHYVFVYYLTQRWWLVFVISSASRLVLSSILIVTLVLYHLNYCQKMNCYYCYLDFLFYQRFSFHSSFCGWTHNHFFSQSK